jgi:hypothetical protein
MAKKITKITPEQTARFGDWAKQWIKIGLSTEPADFDRATEAALRAYDLCNLKRPMVVLRMGSPYAATVGGAMAWMMLKQVESQVWSQVESQVRPHDTHESYRLTPGVYEVRQQREYVPEGYRRAAD